MTISANDLGKDNLLELNVKVQVYRDVMVKKKEEEKRDKKNTNIHISLFSKPAVGDRILQSSSLMKFLNAKSLDLTFTI